jgi:two-component system sensor histidine kinase ResE
MQTITAYLRLFVAWGTAWYAKYRSDLFTHTTVNIILLQTGLVVVTIVAFWMVLQYANREMLSYIVTHIEEILQGSIQGPQEIEAAVNAIQNRAVWYIFGGVIAIAAFFGVVLARFTLGPARDTLRRQKLFVSNIAHELRTPLSSIKTSTEVALLDEKVQPEVRKTLNSIVEELNRISDIINNLLSLDTFSRPERMKFQDIDMGPILKEVVGRHMALAREGNTRIILKMDSHRIVRGNAAALEQVVTNLVRNALNYTPKDSGGVVTVSLQPDYHGSMVLIVADTGVGIAQQDLFHIFEPFYRADTSRTRGRRKTGSGLGLSIVNEIVRLHHGRIAVESALRKGTVVSVYLPAGANRDMNGTRSLESKQRSEISVDFSNDTSLPLR